MYTWKAPPGRRLLSTPLVRLVVVAVPRRGGTRPQRPRRARPRPRRPRPVAAVSVSLDLVQKVSEDVARPRALGPVHLVLGTVRIMALVNRPPQRRLVFRPLLRPRVVRPPPLLLPLLLPLRSGTR
jgi:hypothetical protein